MKNKHKKRRRRYGRLRKSSVIITALIIIALFVTNNVIVAPLVSVINGSADNAITSTVNKKNSYNVVSFKAVGDNLIHSQLSRVSLKSGKYDYSTLYTEIKDDLKKSDLSFINQETVLGGSSRPSGYPRFNTPDSMMNALNYMGIDVVNGATNHSLDQGVSGVSHMVSLFKNQNKMTLIGLYTSQNDYDNISIVEKNGIKFAFLSYTYGSNAGGGNSYTLKKFDEDLITKEVKEAKKKADFVVVSAHWGIEYNDTPSIFQDTYAQKFAELGVDLVIGTHPHVIQKMSWITNSDGHKTLVAYSLGNFVSSQTSSTSLLGGMLSLDFEMKDKTKSIKNVKWVPIFTHIEGQQGSSSFRNVTKVKVYKLKNYTTKLSRQHVLNNSSTNFTKSTLENHTKEIIEDFTIDV